MSFHVAILFYCQKMAFKLYFTIGLCKMEGMNTTNLTLQISSEKSMPLTSEDILSQIRALTTAPARAKDLALLRKAANAYTEAENFKNRCKCVLLVLDHPEITNYSQVTSLFDSVHRKECNDHWVKRWLTRFVASGI